MLLLARLPEGPALFPDDEVTDQPLEIRLAELVREQALAVTREEVPHSVAVMIDEMERDGRPHEGARLDRRRARFAEGDPDRQGGPDPEDDRHRRPGSRWKPLLGTKVYLDLHVKVMKEWQRDPKALDRLGF